MLSCSKCGGYVMQETFYENPDSFCAWKCLNCGKVFVPKQRALEPTVFDTFYYQATHVCSSKPIIKKFLKS